MGICASVLQQKKSINISDLDLKFIENPIKKTIKNLHVLKNINTHKYNKIDFKKNIIDRLPVLLVFKIYKDYLEGEVYYIIYKNIIETEDSRCLNNKKLPLLIPTILSKPHVCKYISQKCNAFFVNFKSHKIKNQKNFILMNKGDSFSLSILFYIYH